MHFSQWEMHADLLIQFCEVLVGAVEYERRCLALPVDAQRVHVVLFRVVPLLKAEALDAD